MLLLLVTAQFEDVKDEEASLNSSVYDFTIEIDADSLDGESKQKTKKSIQLKYNDYLDSI